MNNSLLPCPFCGGEAELHDGVVIIPVIDENGAYIDADVEDTPAWVECAACGAATDGVDSAEEAIAAWNRRSKLENEPLTLDELRQMDGEPVWMARAKKWVFVSTVVTEPYAQVWYFFKGFVYTVLYYHEKFYRNKPERSEG